MDWDPELEVTLSNGRRVVTFEIAAVAGAGEAWAVLEPGARRRVILGRAAAVDARQRVDTRIAARLAAGWVPVDGRPAGAPRVPPAVPPDLGLQISSLLEALARGRPALQAADPSGQLWAACQVFRHQAWRFGVGVPGARLARARQERRLGELAEQAGDLPAARLHYRAALASHAGVGVTRRLARLEAPATEAAAGPAPPCPASSCGPRGFATASPADSPHAPSTRRRREGCVCRGDRPSHAGGDRRRRACAHGRGPAGGPARRRSPGPASGDRSSGPRLRHAETEGGQMKTRVQIVGRIPGELSRRVRAAAKRRKVTLNALLIEALAQAVVSPRRAAETKGA